MYLLLVYCSGTSGQLDFALGSKSTGESVSGHVYFSVTFTLPPANTAACSGHGGLECPGELDRMRLKSETLLDSHSDQELITNGHVGFRKNPLKSNNNSSSASSMSNGMGSSFGDEEVALNGEAGLGEARLDNGQDYTSSSSRESDYSPIWKYSCKVPNVASKGKTTESRGEEAIYETVYPAEDYHTQEGEVTEAGPILPQSDEDSPPPLPPRTKSLMKSLAEMGHRPLARSMAVQLGLAPTFPTVVRKRPLPLPDTPTPSGDQVMPLNGSVKDVNSAGEPSVRPKAPVLSASSQSSCDSESSGASYGDGKRMQYPLEGSFSYDIVDLDEVLQISEMSYNQTDTDSQCQAGKSLTQGPSSSLQSSSCASMESEPSEDIARPSTFSDAPEEVMDSVSGESVKDRSCATVAPLATPEQDSSLLQEAASTDTLLESSEVLDLDVNKSCSGSSHIPKVMDSECNVIPSNSQNTGVESFNIKEHSLPEIANNQSDSLSSPVNVTYVCGVMASAQERRSSFVGDITGDFASQSAVCADNVDTHDDSEVRTHGNLLTSKSDSVHSDVPDQEVTSGLRVSREGSVSGRSPSPRLSDSLQVSSSTSESISPAGGSTSCSLSSQAGEDGRRGSESTCMVVSTESSSSNSVFASPTTETNDLDLVSLVSAAQFVDMNIPSGTLREPQTPGQEAQEASVRPRKDLSTQVPAVNGEDDDIPPAVPPHKPHHGLLKALVHPPLCPPTPTHRAKPQPPERTTSDRRERDTNVFGKEETWEREDKSLPSHHPKLSRQPSLRDWLKRYPKVEVAFDEPLPSSE